MGYNKKYIILSSLFIFLFVLCQMAYAQPAPPQLHSPADGATDQPLTITFKWSSVSSADRYQIQVATDSSFSSSAVVHDDNTTSTSITFSGFSHDTKYYWRVRSGQDGLLGGTTYGNWSNVRNFTTVEAAPPAPTLNSPSDGASGISTSPTLDWNSAKRADSYHIQLSQTSDFSSTAMDSANITSTQIDVAGLQSKTTYYWRVQASNKGGTSNWSSVYSFTTQQPPPNAPTLSSPADGASGVSRTPTLDWNAASGADTYQVQAATDASFSSIIVNQSGISSTSYQTDTLDYSTQYYWRVRASNNAGSSSWSSAWSFTTQPAPSNPPNAPTLSSPSDGSTGVATNPTLDWNAAQNADSYHLQVATGSDFSAPAVDQSGLSTTSYQASGLNNGTTYHWRVQASNSGGSSSWSSTWSFTTQAASSNPPNAPTLSSPADGASGVSRTPTLDWNAASGADTYQVQAATDASFSSVIVNQSGINSTSYQTDTLDYSTQYYWRVRATNSDGSSSWSSTWSFTTRKSEHKITVTDPTKNTLWKASDTYNIRWNASSSVNTVRLEYSTDNGKDWKLIAKQIGADKGEYGWKAPNLSAAYSRIKITDEQDTTTFDTSPSFMIYPQSLKLDKEIKFSSSPSQSDYKLVALPAQTDIPLDQIFKGTYGDDWKAFYDNGKTNNYMVEYDKSDNFNFKPGRGFWVINRGNIQVSEEAPSVDLDSDTSYAIPLHKGWNIISNPFHVPVGWSAVKAANNINDPIWNFDGQFSKSDLFNPYEGYYFFNKGNRSKLVIPYDPEKTKGKSSVASDKKVVSLSIFHDGKRQSSIRLGVDPTVVQNPDRRYQPAPPGNFQKYKLTLKPTKKEHTPYKLAEIYRPAPGDFKTLTLHLKSETHEPITLKADGLQKLAPYRLVLVNQRSGKSYPLHDGHSIRMSLGKEHNVFKLLIGTSDEIKQQQQQSGPTQLKLSQNYPNPFNGQTVITYSIPKRMGQTKVQLQIFDVIGRKILTLVNKKQNPGFYRVHWNEENTSKSLASGVYYYRLRVGSTVLTKQLTLIK